MIFFYDNTNKVPSMLTFKYSDNLEFYSWTLGAQYVNNKYEVFLLRSTTDSPDYNYLRYYINRKAATEPIYKTSFTFDVSNNALQASTAVTYSTVTLG
jgi:hypothetical protein